MRFNETAAVVLVGKIAGALLGLTIWALALLGLYLIHPGLLLLAAAYLFYWFFVIRVDKKISPICREESQGAGIH